MIAKKLSVLIVDDSSFMRLVIRDMLEQDERIEVVDAAKDGKEALEKTLVLSPDVVIMDMAMEHYDGLYGIKHIMEQKPTPILVLSAAGLDDKQIVFEALELGAVDFLNKPEKGRSGKIRNVAEELIGKVREMGGLLPESLTKKRDNKHFHQHHSFSGKLPYKIIAIGASTGGPGAVESVLTKLPFNLPIPVVVVQHMPDNFVEPFARRLAGLLPLEVVVAKDGTPLQNGVVYICSTKGNLRLERDGARLLFQEDPKHYRAYNFPSIDGLLLSVAEHFRGEAVGLVLSGMGSDGTEGLGSLKGAGALTIAQDEQSSIVYGMPKSAKESGAATYSLPVNEIAPFIISNF